MINHKGTAMEKDGGDWPRCKRQTWKIEAKIFNIRKPGPTCKRGYYPACNTDGNTHNSAFQQTMNNCCARSCRENIASSYRLVFMWHTLSFHNPALKLKWQNWFAFFQLLDRSRTSQKAKQDWLRKQYSKITETRWNNRCGWKVNEMSGSGEVCFVRLTCLLPIWFLLVKQYLWSINGSEI